MDLENFPDNQTAKEMLSYVTKGFYDDSYVGKWIFQVMGLELSQAQRLYRKLIRQIFPESATFGLRYQEEKYGLAVKENLSVEERRKLIKEKRDSRVWMNPHQMENVLQTMTGCTVVVTDDLPEANTFRVIFHNGEGAVSFDKVRKKIMSLKQSHVLLLEMEENIKNEMNRRMGMAHQVSKTIHQVIN